MNFKKHYFKESIKVLDNGNIFIDDVDDISVSVLKKINTAMKRAGYDWRGAEDARDILRMSFLKKEISPEKWPKQYKAISDSIKTVKDLPVEEQMFRKASRYFGLTNDPNFAAYILPNGKMLDFSGRKQGNRYATSRGLDHRNIVSALDDFKHPAAGGGTDGMVEFMKLGPIRIDGNSGLIDMYTKPTPKQRNAIQAFVNKMSSDDLRLELQGKGERVNREYEKPFRIYEILKTIDSYFAGTLQQREPSLAAQFHGEGFLRKLKESINDQNYVVVYSGRFQPFHKAHKETYDNLVKEFGKDNVYIATSNKVDPPKSPFDFNEKKKIITSMFLDIPDDKIVMVKNPYNPVEILDKQDENTIYITAIGKKDKDRLTNREYFSAFKDKKNLKTSEEHGYYFITPENTKYYEGEKLSGTLIRDIIASSSDSKKEDLFRQLYPKFDSNIFRLLRQKIKE